MQFQVNQPVTLTASFTNKSGVLTDPTTVLVMIKDPDGLVTVATPTKESTGVYSYALTLSQAGTWHYRFEGSGALEAVFESDLTVEASEF